MKKVTLFCFAAASFVSACDVPIEPAISSFNEASVAIQFHGSLFEYANAETRNTVIKKADTLARDTCRRGPKRNAEFVSSRNIPTGGYNFVTERLYLCLN